MKLSKNVNNKKCAPNWYCSLKKIFRKFWLIFDLKKWLWKSDFCNFWQLLCKCTHDLIFLLGWLLALSIKEGPVKCATVCVNFVLFTTWHTTHMLCSGIDWDFWLNSWQPKYPNSRWNKHVDSRDLTPDLRSYFVN